jgi:hypothetical protein
MTKNKKTEKTVEDKYQELAVAYNKLASRYNKVLSVINELGLNIQVVCTQNKIASS